MIADLHTIQGQLLYEVAYSDTYRFRSLLPIQPDVVYDIGACLGECTLWAGLIFPTAKIIAVEPDDNNAQFLTYFFREIPRVTVIKVALGIGSQLATEPRSAPHRIFRNAAHRVRSPQIDFQKHPVRAMSLAELYEQHGGNCYVIKLDCEGAEGYIFDDPDSLTVACGAAFIGLEVHWNMDCGEPGYRERLLGLHDALLRSHDMIDRRGDPNTSEIIVYRNKKIARC